MSVRSASTRRASWYYCNYSAGTISKIIPAIAPPPAISSVSPSGGSIGGATGVTIAGTGFQSGARVTIGGTAAPSVVVASATSITAITPAHAAGAVTVMVTNPDNQSAVAASAFTYRTDPVAPFGSFDTPLDGSTGVAGSIAVTGWALDDVQVTRVTICRDPIAGEGVGGDPRCNGSAQVYISDAVFIPGARPDVQAAFPSTPLNARAGWGYLLLTIFLPNQGNGAFVLRTYAFDADGHATALGQKQIACQNSGSLAPFGAIDTPAQGATISGASYPNFGWVLSPGTRRSDPPGGGTVQVLVDGVPVGSPGGWTAPLGYLVAVPAVTVCRGGHRARRLRPEHDDARRRVAYDRVERDRQPRRPPGDRQPVLHRRERRDLGSEIGDLGSGIRSERGAGEPEAGSWQPDAFVSGRVGFDVDAPMQLYMPDAHGRVVVAIEELGRIELAVDATSGYLQTPAGRAPLPAGSRIDPATGTFTWQPGAGFLGVFDLVFGDLRVRIIVAPRR